MYSNLIAFKLNKEFINKWLRNGSGKSSEDLHSGTVPDLKRTIQTVADAMTAPEFLIHLWKYFKP
jgi:hypothetical protein